MKKKKEERIYKTQDLTDLYTKMVSENIELDIFRLQRMWDEIMKDLNA
jgi:hypothetical protein